MVALMAGPTVAYLGEKLAESKAASMAALTVDQMAASKAVKTVESKAEQKVDQKAGHLAEPTAV